MKLCPIEMTVLYDPEGICITWNFIFEIWLSINRKKKWCCKISFSQWTWPREFFAMVNTVVAIWWDLTSCRYLHSYYSSLSISKLIKNDYWIISWNSCVFMAKKLYIRHQNRTFAIRGSALQRRHPSIVWKHHKLTELDDISSLLRPAIVK